MSLKGTVGNVNQLQNVSWVELNPLKELKGSLILLDPSTECDNDSIRQFWGE